MDLQGRPELGLEDLARETGEVAEQLVEWRSLGLLGAKECAGFSLEDVEVVRLIQFCLRRGSSIEALARAEVAEPGFLRHYVRQLPPEGVEPKHTLQEAAGIAELDPRKTLCSSFSGSPQTRLAGLPRPRHASSTSTFTSV